MNDVKTGNTGLNQTKKSAWSAIVLTPEILGLIEETRKGAIEELEAANIIPNDKPDPNFPQSIQGNAELKNFYTELLRNKWLDNDITLKELFGRTGDLNVKGSFGKTILMHLIIKGGEDQIKWMLRFDVNVNEKDDFGNTALSMLLEDTKHNYNNSGIIELIIEKGGDVNSKVKGDPLLVFYHKAKNQHMVKKLIEKGADPNLTSDSNGLSILYYAIHNIEHYTVNYLLDFCNPNQKTPSGHDAYSFARSTKVKGALAEKAKEDLCELIYNHPKYNKPVKAIFTRFFFGKS